MMTDPCNSRITIYVAEHHEAWFIHGLVAVQFTFPVPTIRMEDAGSLRKVIEPVIEQAEAAGHRWNPPQATRHNFCPRAPRLGAVRQLKGETWNRGGCVEPGPGPCIATTLTGELFESDVVPQ